MNNATTNPAAAKTSRTIFVCKACKKAGRPGFVRAVEFDAFGYTLNRAGERLPFAQQGHTEAATCPTCKRYNQGSPVHGKKNDHVCDARCLAATGGQCECSCGGKNHGASYL